jgi:hypothetical protein
LSVLVPFSCNLFLCVLLVLSVLVPFSCNLFFFNMGLLPGYCVWQDLILIVVPVHIDVQS